MNEHVTMVRPVHAPLPLGAEQLMRTDSLTEQPYPLGPAPLVDHSPLEILVPVSLIILALWFILMGARQ